MYVGYGKAVDFIIKESEYSNKGKGLILEGNVETGRRVVPWASKCHEVTKCWSTGPECKMIKQEEKEIVTWNEGVFLKREVKFF